MIWAAALCGAAALLIILREGAVLEPAGVLICIAVLLLATVRTVVTVERHGVRARIGIYGVPRRFIGIDTIERAVVVNVRPIRDFGGWGDRLKRARRGFVCRRGEAIRLDLTRGPSLVITIDNARRAADRINQFVDENRATSPRKPKPKRKRRRAKPTGPLF